MAKRNLINSRIQLDENAHAFWPCPFRFLLMPKKQTLHQAGFVHCNILKDNRMELHHAAHSTHATHSAHATHAATTATQISSRLVFR